MNVKHEEFDERVKEGGGLHRSSAILKPCDAEVEYWNKLVATIFESFKPIAFGWCKRTIKL